jgi:hypothetical protein
MPMLKPEAVKEFQMMIDPFGDMEPELCMKRPL